MEFALYAIIAAGFIALCHTQFVVWLTAYVRRRVTLDNALHDQLVRQAQKHLTKLYQLEQEQRLQAIVANTWRTSAECLAHYREATENSAGVTTVVEGCLELGYLEHAIRARNLLRDFIPHTRKQLEEMHAIIKSA